MSQPREDQPAVHTQPSEASLFAASWDLPDHRLDELDRQLVELLRNDGRASFRALANATGNPEATVRKRVRRLLDDRAVQVVAIPSLIADGGSVIASVRLAVRGVAPDAIAEHIAGWNETSWVAVGLGSRAVMAEVVARSLADVWDVVARLHALDGVVGVDPVIVTRTFKQLYLGPTHPTQ